MATSFAKRWVTGQDTEAADWLAGLQPLSTEEYGRSLLPTVDPGSVPARRVTGSAKLIRQTGGEAEVAVPLDALTIHVLLVDTTGEGTWRVADVTQDGR